MARENALRKVLAVPRARTSASWASTRWWATELEIWGKPTNAEAAALTLRRLSGRTHDVISGYAFAHGEHVHAGEEVTG